MRADLLFRSRPLRSRDMTTIQGLTNLFVIASPETFRRIENLIAFRCYGFVNHVELIPPSQLLRVPSHPPGRSVLMNYPNELHFSPRILPLSYTRSSYDTTFLRSTIYLRSLLSSLASVPLVLVDDHTGHICHSSSRLIQHQATLAPKLDWCLCCRFFVL
jgi:hypothetical protein